MTSAAAGVSFLHMSSVHFSSKTDQWSTPQGFFDEVNKRFGGFDFDAAANPGNAKCVNYSSDSLNIKWAEQSATKRIWLNPPYGRTIKDFIAKAVEAQKEGCLVVCLLPARTDTNWWHQYVIPHGRVEFIRGRLKFSGSKNAAPFPSALVVFHP